MPRSMVFKDSVKQPVSRLSVVPCKSMFTQFEECLRDHATVTDQFDLCKAYMELAVDQLGILSECNRRPVVGIEKIDQSILVTYLKMLRSERNSWRLAAMLLWDREKMRNIDADELLFDNTMEMVVDTPGGGSQVSKKMTDFEVVEDYIIKNNKVREMQRILDWLQMNEADDMEENVDKIEYYCEGPHARENTLHDLKNRKRAASQGIRRDEDRKICPYMDPDGPTRSGMPLNHLDSEDEHRLYRQIFKLLRAGLFHQVDEIADRLGYHWLSAALKGWYLHDDKNFNFERKGGEYLAHMGDSANIGNKSRDVWKMVCWEMCRSNGISTYKKALFGLLSGNLSQAVPVCTRWEDKLWAFLRCTMDVHAEKTLRETVYSSNEYEPRYKCDFPAEYWENLLTIEEVFRRLENSDDLVPVVGEERAHQTIQKYLILNEIDQLIDFMLALVKDFTEWGVNIPSDPNFRASDAASGIVLNDTSKPHFLRFVAHLALLLRYLGYAENRDLQCLAIIEAYVQYLINSYVRDQDNDFIELIAPYASYLPEANQVVCYSRLLKDIEDKTLRRRCLKLAEKAGLDVMAITKHVVVEIRRAPLAGDQHVPRDDDLSAPTTESDRKKINSLDWLLYGDSLTTQYSEVLVQGNALMRIFLLQRKVDAARETMAKLPGDIIDGVVKQWRRKTGSTQLNARDAAATREYLCHKAYLQALDSFNDWIKFYHESRPKPPSQPGDTSKYADKVAYSQAMKRHEREMEQWHAMLLQQSNLCTEKIYNVLLFPDGGWMRDSASAPAPPDDSLESVMMSGTGQDEVMDDDRSEVLATAHDRHQQMNLLRKTFIPTLVFMLHSIHQSTEQLKDCVQLADIVATERHALYKEFTQSQMREFLGKIRESSVLLLKKTGDPLGYSTEQNADSTQDVNDESEVSQNRETAD